MKNYVCAGDVLSLHAAAPVASGEVIALGALVGVAANSAKTGEPLDARLRGVFEVPKPSAETWTPGLPLFLTADGVVTSDDDSPNLAAGHAFSTSPSGAASGWIRLLG